MGYVGVDWVHVAQDRVQWRAFVKTLTILGFHKRQGIFD
jgi:hypothetical protein